MRTTLALAAVLAGTVAQAASTLFWGGTIIAFDSDNESLRVIRNGSLLVVDDRIAAVHDDSQSPYNSVPADTVKIDVTGQIITPGFIDTHRHSWQTAYKTIGSNTTLLEYFSRYGEYAAASSYRPEDVYLGQLMGLYEALDGGVTTLLDHAHHTWSNATAYAGLNATVESGARVFWSYAFHNISSLNYTIPQQIPNFREIAESGIFDNTTTELGIAFDSWGPNPDVAEAEQIVHLAHQYNVSVVTTHCLSGPWGFNNLPEDVQRFDMLNGTIPVVFSHASFITAQGAELLRSTNQYISITPESEMHYGHTHPHSYMLQDQAALGVDTHFTYSGDILTQARLWLQSVRYYFSWGVLQDWGLPSRNPMSANQAFKLATRAGGLALRRPDLGVIQVGAKADLVVWNARKSLSMVGWTDPVAAVILHANAGDVLDVMTGPPSPSQSHDSPDQPVIRPGITVDTVCKGLGISRDVYTYLIKSYFSNMTTFTLFKPNGIEAKFALMRSPVEAEALVATIFAFSARFHSSDRDPSRIAECPTPSYFAAIASRRLQDALDSYEDTTPPFHLLQAMVLDVFYNIFKSLRSKSWRYLGQAIRLGYDLKLHLLDIHSVDSDGDKTDRDLERWSLLEERRRAWWALWELDVFASTIRRLPLAIDWTQNFTWLPAPDACWLQGVYKQSCFLAPDPGQRWKNMSRVVNTSAKAWLIVVTSLMHDAQQLVYNPLPVSESSSFQSKKDNLAIIANALYCTTSSMPRELVYEGQALDFDTKTRPRDINCRQFHADIYSIYLMTQLVHFMSDHHVVCAQMAAAARAHAANAPRAGDSPSWSNYMAAAENIVTIVRNSAHNHVRYVNPLFTNTLWFAAASQIACKLVGPSCRAEALAASNYDLLELTIQRCTSFWGSNDILKPRLDTIEAELRSLVAKNADKAADGDEALGRKDLGAAEDNLPPGPAPINGTSFHGSGLVGAQGVSMDAVQMPFVPLFPSGHDPNSLSEQIVFDDLEHFLPYGLDELWKL
ncbi:hypothetical protein H634G_09709 [Metarhizium anisopliae BRIP 53293]|uniref:Xylanolytic transcriptional activator regulatory domain-containing protein n=1 Tax=Metarhizium anisopliae BRIP 53293 TaxID=1291518 RepID=A0A0D9NMC3_METAN|nr:hypothetical protein H634G_09709 [Metarhizium anisopliae BRIP 53293]